MKLISHKIDGVPYRAARAIGARIVPEIVILHDTASRLERGNAADYLRNNAAGVSVHFVIERDGSIEQQVPTNRRAGHAGLSSYHGRRDCNAFSIGIELVNPGRMRRVTADSALAWWGDEFPIGEGAADDISGGFVTVEATTRAHGSGVWMDYPPEQIEALRALLVALFAGIPTLRNITTHWYVSPGRKVDPNPLFPLEELRAAVLGEDPVDATVMDASAEEPTSRFVRIVVPGGSLNLRRWPSFNPNVLHAIPDGTRVPVLRDGVFEGRRWLMTMHDGCEGWVLDAYTKPA